MQVFLRQIYRPEPMAITNSALVDRLRQMMPFAAQTKQSCRETGSSDCVSIIHRIFKRLYSDTSARSPFLFRFFILLLPWERITEQCLQRRFSHICSNRIDPDLSLIFSMSRPDVSRRSQNTKCLGPFFLSKNPTFTQFL